MSSRFCSGLISDFSPSFGHPPKEDTQFFRESVINDIALLQWIKPLVLSEKIRILTPSSKICPYCFAKHVFGLKAGSRIENSKNKISKNLFKRMSILLSCEGGEYVAGIEGLEDIFEHGLNIRVKNLPNIISDNYELLEKVKNGEAVKLTEIQMKEFDYNERFTSQILKSIAYQIAVSGALGTSLVTHRNIDVDILSYISGEKDSHRRDPITTQYMQVIVPFAGDVPIDKLLTLRNREEDAFVQFRLALKRLIDEITANKGTFSEHDARTLYADVITPEISRLELKVNEAKRDLVMKPLSSAAGTVAVIAFGIYAGMIPAEISEVAALLGLSKMIYDTASKAVELSDLKKTIRPEKYYYLWKVKHLK